MTMALHLRDITALDDVESFSRLVRATGMFSEEEAETVREIVEARLANGTGSGYRFLLAEHDGLLGFTCYGRIPLTQSSYDLYWIAVAPGAQRKGLGRRLLGLVEQAVMALGGHALYVDTSGRPRYETTRAFYRACGYGQAARLVDFYAPGDDKIVLLKRLTAA
jgi:ribosomal protein S18 acetylase RimI-like enzyme